MNLVVFITAAVFGFMLAEQRLSRANERALRAAGAIEPPGDPYRALAVLYPSAFLAMGVEGIWRARGIQGDAAGPSWLLSGVVLFLASKGLKYWAIGTLGDRWSFRVLIQPGRPLVRTGPYRYVDHPNYVAIVGELVGTAMMVKALVMGPVALIVFGAALVRRLRFEEGVLRGFRSGETP
jgi:methyltransferase